MQESAILFGMNNVAANGQKFLNNFYLKSKRSVAKARTEGRPPGYSPRMIRGLQNRPVFSISYAFRA